MAVVILCGQVTEVERDTLEVVVRHVGRVAEVTNKMDVDNLALLFGQVLLWPDASIPMDFKLMAGRTLHYSFRFVKICIYAYISFQRHPKTCKLLML